MSISDKDLMDIEKMPKVILHLHLYGSLRAETVLKRLKENPLTEEEINKWFENKDIFESDKKVLLEIVEKGKNITLEDVKEKLSVDKNCRNLNQYLEKFALPCSVLQTKEDIEKSTYELFQDLSKQNVVYAEVRFAPSKHTLNGLSEKEVTEAAILGLKKAKKDFKMDGNLILCCMRGEGEKNHQENLKVVDVAKEFLKKGVCAIDLAGAEALFKTKNFEDIFQKAKENNIPFTIHAGEADGPESIQSAINFGASRIGHGVQSINDNKLLNLLRENEIALEICPTSNLQTQAIEEGKLPIEMLYRLGIPTTINPDNNTVSNTNIIEELKWVLENTNLTVNDLLQMQKNASRGAFIPVQNKADLVGKINLYAKSKEKVK